MSALRRFTLLLYAGYAVSLLASLVILKTLATDLSSSDLGLYFLFGGVVLVVAEMAKGGASLLLPALVPRLAHEGLDRSLVGLSLSVHAAIGVLLFVGSLALPALREERWAVLAPLAVLAFYAHVHLSLAMSALLAGCRPGLFAAVGALSGLTVAALFLPGKLTLTRALLTAAAVYGAFAAVCWALLAPSLRRWRAVWTRAWREWLWASLDAAIAPVFTYADRLILAPTLGLASVAAFGVLRRVEAFGRTVFGIPLDALVPLASFRYGAGEVMKLKRFARLYFAASLAALALAGPLGAPALRLVTSADYARHAPLLVLLWAGASAGCIYFPYTTLARATGDMRSFLAVDAAWVGSFLVCALVGVSLFGLTGVAAAPLTASLVSLAVAARILSRMPRARTTLARLALLALVTACALGGYARPALWLVSPLGVALSLLL